MKFPNPLLLITFLLAIVFFSCQKKFIEESALPVDVNDEEELPDNYAFASGVCAGNSLGIPIIDTAYYRPHTNENLPDSLILNMPEPGNQASQNSCAAWTVIYGAGSYYQHIKSDIAFHDTLNLSPAYTYNQIAKGDCDCSSFLDHLYLLKTEGACSISSMEYEYEDCSEQPDSLQKIEASRFRIGGWKKVNLKNIGFVKQAVTEKKPVIFSIKIDDGFKSLSNPFVWSARKGATGLSHGMLVVGYDDSRNAFRVMNSWSTGWADKGFAWIDYQFFTDNADNNSGYIISE